MRILAIRGARLASLEAPFEVDLAAEPLRSAGVFAIVGPTGAGKSSLLDALCLALFDTTPRLERTPRQRIEEEGEGGDDLSGRDARTLVRRGAKDAFAEVDFVGVDGKTYRARWAVERGRTGRLRPTQLSLRDVASGRATSGTKGEVLAAIEGKLGLGLAELRRAVLLPQGEVAAFLDAPSDERALLLERLTGAEIFAEVSKVVHARAADARRAQENVEITLGMLAVLEPGEVVRMEEELAAARLEGARAEERTAALVAHRERCAGLVRLREDERQARETVDELERQRGLAELGRGDVALADRVELAAAELAEEQRALRGERDAAARWEAERAEHAQALASIAPLADAAEKAGAALRAREEAAAGARQAREASLAAARDRVASLPSASAGDEIERLRARERVLARMLRAFERVRAARVAEERAEHGLAEARVVHRTSGGTVARLDARALELALDASAQSARLDEARRAHERIVVARSLEAHRADLVDGEPCPLCGALEHPVAHGAVVAISASSEERVATIRLALERTRATLGRVQASAKLQQREAASAEARARGLEQERARARAEREVAEGESAACTVELGGEAFASEAAITDAIAQAETRVRVLDADVRAERAARDALATLEASVREAERAADRARAEQASRHDAAVRAAERAAERAQALAESVARHGEVVAALAAASAAARAAADRALSAVQVGRADAERILGPDRERIRRVRADLARLDRERASARATLEERQARRLAEEALLEERVAPAGEALDLAVSEARAGRDAARRREAMLEAALAHDRGARGRAAELAEAHARAQKEVARWEGLDALIGAADGKRFRAHAQSLTLERLVSFANAELMHLAPRFSLARAPAAGELALSVIDREAGYARRSVQSLSGGESFLVSLALALGLAAMTAAEGGRGALSASSLFLDEGLGALDPASLEIALAALEALRASGRQIAIVTHVPQVAERFAARVEVVPRGPGRSDVRVLRS